MKFREIWTVTWSVWKQPALISGIMIFLVDYKLKSNIASTAKLFQNDSLEGLQHARPYVKC